MKCFPIIILTLFSQVNMENGKFERVIVDVDAGVDDYLGLLLIIYAESLGKVKIEGIICTRGNTDVENVCKNVIRLLELLDRTDIPVYRGTSNPLLPTDDVIDQYFGADGFGDLNLEPEPNLDIIQQIPAAIALRDLVANNPNEITLICLGPLTNVALAIKLDDKFVDNLKDLWLMGGNYQAVGNCRATAEFNFCVDPEAATIVLHSIIKPIHVLPWETCRDHVIDLEWRQEVFGCIDKPYIELYNKAEGVLFEGSDVWRSCDGYLIGAFMDPTNIIMDEESHIVKVDTKGVETKGQMYIDRKNDRMDNAIIIKSLNTDSFKKLLIDMTMTL